MRLDRYTEEMIGRVQNGYIGSINISSICNGLCIYCSNKQNPFDFEGDDFCTLNYVRTALDLLKPGIPYLSLSDTLPGRMREGEALLHPKLPQILNIIRKREPIIPISIRTNASFLTEKLISKLKPYNPINISISYDSYNKENWCKMKSLGAKSYENATNSFSLLKSEGFGVEASIVSIPNLVGYKDIEKTLKYIMKYTKRITVWYPGYTNYTPENIKTLMDTDYSELDNFFLGMSKKYKINFVQLPPSIPINFYPSNLIYKLSQYENVYWLFSEAAYKQGKRILKSFNTYNNNVAVCVKNKSYEGNIICAGLLMVEDFEKAINSSLKNKVDYFVVPRVPFDSLGRDLKLVSKFDLLKFNIPMIYE